MNQGKFVFAQIVDFLPQRIFDKYVKQDNGNKYIKHFTCWNQLLCMVFGELINRVKFYMVWVYRYQTKHLSNQLSLTLILVDSNGRK